MSTNCYMFTNHCNNISCVDLYLLQMELGIEEGLVDAEQLSQTPELPSTSTTSNHATPAARASRSQNQDMDSGKYFVWDNDKVLRLVTILFDSNYYQRSLLKGRLTKEQEKGLKMSKETLYKQIFDKIFPNSNITNSGSCVKTKLRWLESQYITIKKTFSQTGSGLLLCNLSPDHSLPLVRNRPIGYKEATGGVEEKITILEGKDRIEGKVSHARSRSEFSQEEDQAQEHEVNYHTRGTCS
ncbi:uncharacterized protein UDID_17681 [Ustilago sp. UG-2017a]|nr:uncharacterized protein UDID_17681 [Ustilago sp. UG-2017a]